MTGRPTEVDPDGRAVASAALALASRGIYVFPVRARTKNPLVTWGTSATTDPDVVARWWSRWPTASVGVATKPSGLTVVDVDGPTGHASWHALAAEHGHTPTASVTTGRDDGGVHYWYRAPKLDPPRNSKGSTGRGIAPGIDIRGAGDGAGGMVLAPPSLHESGRRYTWADRLPLADLPAWLAAEAARAATDHDRTPPHEVRRATTPPTATRGRPQRWAAAAMAGEAADIAGMPPESGRNDALNGAAYKLGRLVAGGLLDGDQVRQALTDAAAACGINPAAAARTITSGITAGARHPRTHAGTV